MHPILAQGRRLALYLFLFLPAGWLLGELLAVGTAAARGEAILLAMPLMLVHSFSCLASWYLCRSLPLGATPPERLVVAQLASGVAASGVLVALGTFTAWLLERTPPHAGAVGRFGDGRPLVFVYALLTFSLAVAVHYLFLAAAASRAAERRAYELKILAREAELKALKAQLDPHFLFNSLSSISGFVVAEPEKARTMCIRLADFLRQSLRLGALAKIPLSEEMALVACYLDVERVRFGDRLQVEQSLAEDAAGCEVPPLILQPLVENAVRHGIAHLLAGGKVSLAASLERGRLVVVVENPCDPDRPQAGRGSRQAGEGFGLDNVRRRLAAAFGAEGRLRVAEGSERFRVTLNVPARRESSAADAPQEDNPIAVGAA